MNAKKGQLTGADADFDTTASDVAENESVTMSPAELEKLYQAKIDGIKGTAIKWQKQNEKLSLEAATLRQQLEEQTLMLTSERDALRAQVLELDKAAKTNAEKASKLERRQQVGTKIMKEYPALSDLFVEGFLVGVEGMEEEDLNDYLARYNEKLTGIADKKLTKAVQGAIPSSAPTIERNPAGMTIAEATANLQKVTAQKGFGSPEYIQAMQLYQEMVMRSATSEK